jgi:polysaccharide biosynthesis/export protein
MKRTAWISVLGALCVAACAWGQEPMPKTGADVPQGYLVGPGDVVQVFVWRNPDLSAEVPVRPDGRITTPLVEDMQAAGKTTTALARDIEAVLQTYVRTPQVNVIVTTPRSVYSEVKVVGAVRTPGPIPYRDGLTVLDAVLAAGGLTDFAAGNRARLVRSRNNKSEEISVRLKDMLGRGELETNVELEPGDVLIVPESLF